MFSFDSPLSGDTRLDHEITSVAWNSSVSHILATSTDGGSVVVWDLRENKPWCTLKDPHRASVGSICWHPDDGLYLATGANDDSRPVVRIWDLRTSTTVPLAEFMGHTKGILSVDWCPHDPNLLISAGKDMHTYIWDIRNGKVIGEAPASVGGQNIVASTAGRVGGGGLATGLGGVSSASDGSAANIFGAPAASASSVFGAPANPMFGGETAASLFGTTLSGSVGGGIAGSSGRRYELKWSKHMPAVFAACSLDRTVTVHSVSAISTTQAPKISLPGYSATPELTLNCAPKWLKRPISAVFGFGGKLLYFGAPSGAINVPVRTLPVPYNKQLKIAQVCVDHDINTRASQLNDLFAALDAGQVDFRGFLDQKIAQSQSAGESEAATNVWRVMRLLLEPDYRQRVITFLGFSLPKTPEQSDSASVADAASTAVPSIDTSLAQTTHQMQQLGLQQQQPQLSGQYAQFGQMQANPYMSTGLSPFDSPFHALPGGTSLVSAEDIFSSSVAPADTDAATETGSTAASAPFPEKADSAATAVSEQGANAGAGAFATPFAEPAPSPTALLGSSEGLLDPNVKYVKKRVPTEEDDNKIKFPLLVGDFASAVDACLDQDRLADALLLAAAAGQTDLWERTREQYFQRKKSPLTALFGHVLKHDLEGLIQNTSTNQWKETLAVLATYASTSQDFSKYAEALGDKLYNEAKDESAATIVYMISLSSYKVNKLWTAQYERTVTVNNQTQLLPVLIEKCLLFRRAVVTAAGQDDIEKGQPEASAILAYANLLSDEGKLSTAAALATRIVDVTDSSTGQRTASSVVGRELRDRLLRAFTYHDIQTPGGMAIANQEFPYQPLDIPEVQVVPRSAYAAQTAPAAQDTGYGQPVPTVPGGGVDHSQYPGYGQPAPAAAQMHYGSTPQQHMLGMQQPHGGLGGLAQAHAGAHTLHQPHQPQHMAHQPQHMAHHAQPAATVAPVAAAHAHTTPAAPSGFVPTPQSTAPLRSSVSHASAFPTPGTTPATSAASTGFTSTGFHHPPAAQPGQPVAGTTSAAHVGFQHPPGQAYQPRTQTPLHGHGQTTPSSGLSASAPAPSSYTTFARPQQPTVQPVQSMQQYGGPGAGPFGMGAPQAAQPVAQTPAPEPAAPTPKELTPEQKRIIDTLLGLSSHLATLPLTPMEQKNLSDANESIEVLRVCASPHLLLYRNHLLFVVTVLLTHLLHLQTKFSLSQVPPDTEAKLTVLVGHAANYALTAASAVQTDLAKNWNVCKDWIKAVRNIITLASVKYPGR